MKFSPEHLYHVYNQGNNQEILFLKDDHYFRFLQLFKAHIFPHCEVIAWCLMPNHFHFLLYADERVNILRKQGGLLLDPITNGFRNLLSTYSHEFNKQNNRSGALFRPKTKAKCLNDQQLVFNGGLNHSDYYSTCFQYIHDNPVNAGLVMQAEDWPWSSHHEYYAPGPKDPFCNRSLAEKYCDIGA